MHARRWCYCPERVLRAVGFAGFGLSAKPEIDSLTKEEVASRARINSGQRAGGARMELLDRPLLQGGGSTLKLHSDPVSG